MEKNKSKFLTLTGVALVSALLMIAILLSAGSVDARQQMYSGQEKHVITLDQATKYIQNFTKSATAPTIKGAYIGRNIFDKILSQPGCVGVRYYYAKKDSVMPTIVLVGVDSSGNDLYQGILGDETYPCPPFCPTPNPLNK